MHKISFPPKLVRAQKSKLFQVVGTKILFQALNFLIKKSFYNTYKLRIILLKIISIKLKILGHN